MMLPLLGILVLILMIILLYFLSKGSRAGNQGEDNKFTAEPESVVRDEKALLEDIKIGKPEAKVRAIEQLLQVESAGVGTVLVEAMGDKNEQVKMAAASALKKLKDPETVPLLIETLKEPTKWIPARVAEVLVAIGTPAIAKVQEAVAGEDEMVRAYAVQILGMMEAEDSYAILRDCLKDPSPEVRRAAAAALAENNSPEAAPAFLEAIKDADAKVRLQAVNALGSLRAANSLEALSEAVKDEDWGVAASAVRALARFGDAGIKIIEEIAVDQGHPCQKQAASLVGDKVKRKGASVNIIFGEKEK